MWYALFGKTATHYNHQSLMALQFSLVSFPVFPEKKKKVSRIETYMPKTLCPNFIIALAKKYVFFISWLIKRKTIQVCLIRTRGQVLRSPRAHLFPSPGVTKAKSRVKSSAWLLYATHLCRSAYLSSTHILSLGSYLGKEKYFEVGWLGQELRTFILPWKKWQGSDPNLGQLCPRDIFSIG